MATISINALRDKALAGDGDAHVLLASFHDQKGQHGEALAWLNRGVGLGHVGCQAQLGARLLTGRAAPYNPPAGAALVAKAAAAGHAESMRFAGVLAAQGAGRTQDWREAFILMRRAAKAGDALARRQLELIGDETAAIKYWNTPAPMSMAFESPRIGICEDFLPPHLCEWIIDRSAPRLGAAAVYDPIDGQQRMRDERSNTGMGFSLLETDLVLQLVCARIAATLDIPVAHQEATNVLHYEVGQEFSQHYDFIDPASDPLAETVEREGQRVATFLIYLNSDFEGGDTAFPQLKWSYKGGAGDAIFFFNVGKDGAPDRQTLHTGTAPTSGEKWLLSKWVRNGRLRLA